MLSSTKLIRFVKTIIKPIIIPIKIDPKLDSHRNHRNRTPHNAQHAINR